MRNLNFFVVFFFLFTSYAHAQEIAEVYALSGSAQFQQPNSATWGDLSKGDRLSEDSLIKVGPSSRLGIRFDDGKLIRLRENSQLRLSTKRNQSEEGVSLIEGALHLFSRTRAGIKNIETPEVSAAIRGTEVVATSENGSTTVTVFDGEVSLENSSGSLRVQSGEQAITEAEQAPRALLVVKSTEQVEWTLFFPTIVSSSEYSDLNSNSSLNGTFQAASRGDFEEVIKRTSSSKLSDEEKLLRASAEMQLGLAKEAESTLKGIQSSNLASARDARLGVLSFVKNDINEAERLYSASLNSSNTSPATALLGSLLKAGRGDISSALEEIEAANKRYPNEPTLLAKKAELLLGSGDTKGALKAAQSARQLAPNDPIVLSVLGFSYLARKEEDDAKDAFNTALQNGDDLALVHFGIGLSLISEGKLEEGRGEIEKAVHLDTTRSLYRSYLGKAFFEEHRTDEAEAEFNLAIERDENDPTPYLYRAFNRLSENKLVPALSDIEDSIERNDARAVYRSSSLLDQDLAVRTTSLAEVFRQLGFREVARIEALKTLSRDYTNYSAHRLLGEVLEGDFFADAKFSQQLISELLSPLSFNTFQATDGFSAESSLNDYAALFDSPEHRTKVNIGSTNVDDTHEGSVIQTGAEGNIGYLASYGTRFEEVSALREHKGRVAVQIEPSIDHRFLIQGAISSLDDETTEDELDQQDVEGSLGSYHRITPETEIITRIEYFGRDSDLDNDLVSDLATQSAMLESGAVVFPEFDIDLDQMAEEDTDSVRGNAQVLHSNDTVSFIGGFEYLYTDGEVDEESMIVGDSAGLFDGLDRDRDSSASYDTTTLSTYGYLTTQITDWLDITTGLSYRDVELPAFDVVPPYLSGERSIDRFSPKVGITVTPRDDLTVRGAYFQVLGTSSVNDVGSIEPTVVGSFVQLLGDLPGAKSENFGIGVDFKEAKSFYAGIEYVYRDIDRTGVDVTTDFITDATTLTDDFSFDPVRAEEQEKEHLIRSYLYTVLSDTTTGLIEYRHDALESVEIGEENNVDRIRTGLRYFSEQMWFLLADLDWYNQDTEGVSGFTDGSEDFWIASVGAGYRLPERRGSLQLQVVNLLDESFDFASRDRFTDPPEGIGYRAIFSINF